MTKDYQSDVVIFGSEVKALGNGRVGGYLVLFSDEKSPDLHGDFFTADTDFGPHKTSLAFYSHGLDETMKKRVLDPEATLTIKDAGVWVEAQLDIRDEYEAAIYDMAKNNKLGWSSGTAGHLVERTTVGDAKRIDKWPLGLDASLTPAPAEPRTAAIPLKSLGPFKPIKSTGSSASDKYNALQSELERVMRDSAWGYPYICDVFDKSIVWVCGSKYFETPYTYTNGKADIDASNPVEVSRMTAYKPVAAESKSLKQDLSAMPVGASLDEHTELLADRWEKNAEDRNSKGELTPDFFTRLDNAVKRMIGVVEKFKPRDGETKATTKELLEIEQIVHRARLRLIRGKK